jgi:hypothetical protein
MAPSAPMARPRPGGGAHKELTRTTVAPTEIEMTKARLHLVKPRRGDPKQAIDDLAGLFKSLTGRLPNEQEMRDALAALSAAPVGSGGLPKDEIDPSPNDGATQRKARPTIRPHGTRGAKRP